MSRLNYQKMKESRLDLDLTQKELSELTGVNINTIKQIETGRSGTDLENLKILCEYLRLDLSLIYQPDFRDTRVLSVVNNKGGCGKTSVATGIASSMAEFGSKVLLIDCDAQRNLSSSFGMPRSKYHLGRAMMEEQNLSASGYIQQTPYENIDIIVADVTMGTLDMQLFTKLNRENIFKSILHPLIESGTYDYIICDTNPNLGLLNYNIILASDFCIVPVQMAAFDVDGLAVVLDFIESVRRFNTGLDVGIVVNRYDARNKLISETSLAQLKEQYEPLLFQQIIRVDAKLQNAQWENRPVLDYACNTRISKEYRMLAKEVMKKCR